MAGRPLRPGRDHHPRRRLQRAAGHRRPRRPARAARPGRRAARLRRRAARRSPTSRGAARRTSGSARSPRRTGGDLVAVVDSVVRELREPALRLSSRPPGRIISRRTPSSRTGAVVLDPVEQRHRRVGEHLRVVGRLGQGEAAAERDERLEPHLQPDPRRRPALAVDVGDHPAGERADRLRDLRPSPRGPVWKVSSRPCARGTHGVASTGLVSTPRPSRWNHGPIVGPSSAASTRASEAASWSTVSMPSAASFLRSCRRSPTAPSVGRVPHHLDPVVRRSAARRRAACRSRSRSWPAACCRRCRPSSAAGSPPAPRRGSAAANSRGSPRSPWPAPGRQERLVPAEHLEHHRHAAPLERPQRRHHLGRGGVVRRAVDRQEHRVRALARRPPAAACRSRRRTPGPRTTPSTPRRARSGRRGRRPRPAARPARGGAAPRPRR